MDVTAFKEAQEAYARGDYALALQGFTVCTQEVGDLSAADLSKFYHLIGNCYIKSGDPASAAKYYKKALDNSSKNRRPALFVNLGTALLNSKDYNNALKAFQSALKYPAYATPYRAHSGIGAAQLKLGNTTEAGAAYREAALDPSNPMPAKALVNLGVCFMELGRAADAIVSYETALDFDLDPIAAAKARSNLGQAYMAEGRVQKAIDEFETVINGGVYELTPIARHDYELACALKDRLDSKIPGILNTGFIPALPLDEEDIGGQLDDEELDPFAPSTDEPVASEDAFADDAATPDAAAEGPAQDVDPDATEAFLPEPLVTPLPVPPESAAQPLIPDEDLANAQTVAFAPVETGSGLQIDSGSDLLAQQPEPLVKPGVDGFAPSDSATFAFAELDKEDDALPSPDDTAFFDVTEKEINNAAKDEVRKERKRRGVGLKVAIVLVILCILVAAAGCAAYFLGYGFPTQETVTENFIAAAKAGEDTSQYWADSVDEGARATQVAVIEGVESCQIEAVERSMSQSVVYVKAKLAEGGEVYYEVVLGRSGVSWSVQYVELFFPSQATN